MTKRAWSVSVLLPAFVLGCGSGSSPTANGPVTSIARQYGSLQFTISATKAVYNKGEPVPLTFLVTNVGTQTIKASSATPITYLMNVTQGSQHVWPSIPGSIDTPTSISFEPGQTVRFQETWDQTYAAGGQVSAGQYSVQAYLTPDTLNSTKLTREEDEQNLFANPLSLAIQD